MEKFRITFDDYLSAQRLHLGWKRWLAPVIFLGVAAAFLVSSILTTSKEQSVTLPVVVSVLFAAVAVLIIPMSQKRQLRRIYTSQKSLHEDMDVSFDNERIEWKSKSGRFGSRWEDLHKYKIGDRVILLYESPNLMRPVP